MLNPDKCNICQTTFMSSFIIHGLGENYAVCAGENVSQTAERVGLEITDRIFKIRNNVVAIFLLLETSKGHSRTRNVLECGHEKKTHN